MATHSQLATLLLVLATLLMTTASLSPPPQPADHLIPPPAPTASPSSSSSSSLSSYAAAAALPVAQRLTHASYSEPAQEGGFMTRVARWFGLGGAAATSPRDQQLSASSQSYAYPKPAQNFDAAGKPCGLCNKYPWVPMMGQQQPQLHRQHQQQQQQLPQQQLTSSWQQPLAQTSQHRQRAVQFHAPSQSVFLPISVPVPGLSQVALPPIYNAQQFRPLLQAQREQQQQLQQQQQQQRQQQQQQQQRQQQHQLQQQQQQQQQLHHLQQQLPLENVGAHSELRPVPFLPTTAPPATHPTSSNFEIVQSHQLTDFVTSVEYPATFVQSHSIDLGQTSAVTSITPLPANHKDREEQLPPLDISTVRYQLEDLSSGAVHQHLPASQLLTELGHFAPSALEPQTTLAPPADNYPAASSQQQLQHDHDQEQEQEQYYSEQYQELAETSTVTPQYEQLLYTTEPPTPAAVELNNHLVSSVVRDGRQRETPKRLLDSPINHGEGGVAPPPRPFTRDPAELNFRLGQPTHPPTPTSTYGAIDASGQFAGMSPPGPQQVIIPYTTKQKPRPFEPSKWTPGWRVRPAQVQDNDVELHEQQESKLVSTATAAPPANTRRTTKYLTKILATNLRELLKRERETKQQPRRPSTTVGVDISKLQHNIDGWTEQEYNSLSHRPSTPTIRGRSKHIPTEYLTTTTPATPTATSTSMRQSKITRGGFELGASATFSNAHGGDLSTSINNLEQLQLKRYPPVDDNRLLDYYEAQHRQSYSTTPIPPSISTTTTTITTTATPATTTTTTTARTTRDMITPLYVRSTPAPMELWKQAKVAILPQTNEKVYVVTPQPRHQPHHSELSASASAQSPVYHTPAPRFPRVRPTPRTSTAGELMAATPTPATEQVRNYTPDIFGLMGLSAYVPAEPVEIIDGNSKVITIVTSAPTAAALQRPTAKSTISPSPR